MSQQVEAFERLVEIREEMGELIQEAADLVRSEFPSNYPNASSYWIAHIQCALGGMGYPTYDPTFEKFLGAAEEAAYEEDEEYEED